MNSSPRHSVDVEVRYAETDQMGVVHHANYLVWLELARTDLCRWAGMPYREINAVRPNLIRVESDEATYNLHIMLRFDLERAMLRDDLRAADLPGAWNERVRRDLGLEVPDDRRGCLQDVHWSMGSIGYFPTYTLGNVYAGGLWAAIRRDLPETDALLRRGETGPLLDWLRRRVHRRGSLDMPAGLVTAACGHAPDEAPLLDYLEEKFAALYRL